ncbi:MAG: hypothetical protein ACM3N6_12925 [Betaproteobacteria bacterium]
MGTYECAPMVENYHVHSHLTLIADGQERAIPDNVGTVKQSDGTFCHYPIHTHDSSGKIHIEAAAPIDATLGDFFRIWGEPLTFTNVAGFTLQPMTVYIVDEDGTVTQYAGDLNAIALLSHRQITIVMGPAIAVIPTFTWSGP